MTSAELIAELQRIDPEGTTSVCVGNRAVYFVHRLPAFYDGYLQELIEDASKKPYYSVVGGRFTSRGSKIDIVALGIDDAISEHPDLPVSFDGNAEGLYGKQVEKWREDARREIAEVEQWAAETENLRLKKIEIEALEWIASHARPSHGGYGTHEQEIRLIAIAKAAIAKLKK